MATTIKLKNGSGAPLAGDLVQGEPALDLTNKRLYTEDSGGTVIEVGTNPSTLTVDTDVLVVDATNNRVGIGTSSPAKLLETVATGAGSDITALQVRNNSSSTSTSTSIRFVNSTGSTSTAGGAELSAIRNASDGGALAFKTAADTTATLTERMRIDSSGNVNIYGTDNRPLAITSFDTASAGAGWDLDATSGNGVVTISTGGSEAMRIDSSGNVGIGTTSPTGGATTVVDVYGSSSSAINFHNATAGTTATDGGVVGQYGNDLVLFNYEAGIIQLGTSNTERMRIDASGNVGIGTSSPQQKTHIVGGGLQITGNITTPASGQTGVLIDYASDGARFWSRGTASARGTYSFIQLENDGGSQQTAMFIDTSGNVGIGTSSPASKLTVNDDGIALRLDGTGNTTRSILLRNVGGSAEGVLRTDGNMHLLQEDASKYMRFSTANTERMRIDSSGNVGIGTTSPSSALHVDSSNDGPIFDSGGTGNTNHALLVRDSANTQLFRVNNDGNVGIGTTSPTNPLTVQSSSGAGAIAVNGRSSDGIGTLSFYASNGTTGQGYVQGRSDHLRMWAPTSNYLTLGTNDAERMRIDTDGHLLIGRSSPAASATDYGMNLYSSGIIYLFANAAGNDDIFRGHNSAGTNTSAIEADGDYIDLSDSRFKQNIVDAPSVINTIKSMPVRSFDWKDRSYGQTYGFVAQELNGICPEVVKVPESEEDVWGVRNSKVVPMLVKAVQEQQAMIEELKAEVAALKGA